MDFTLFGGNIVIIQIDEHCPMVRAMRLAVALCGEYSPPNSLIIPGETRLDDFMNKCRDLNLSLELCGGFGDFILKDACSSTRDRLPKPGGLVVEQIACRQSAAAGK